jgi:tRNA pseudouridine55 synthase
MTASGYLLFDKPAGQTSFTSLNLFKKAFHGSRVGHTGTLDSFATGLLVVMAGSYSRLSSWFVGLDKVYEAEIRFGVETDTLDPHGTITRTGSVPGIEALERVVPTFIGTIQQIPPEYSAIHVAGERASDLARKGESFKLLPREIKIYSLEIASFSGDTAKITVHCSSGTYIRALARDIAAACGTCAYVIGLRRTKVGPFSVADACKSEDQGLAGHLRQLHPENAASLGLDIGFVPTTLESAFSNGIPVALGGITIGTEPSSARLASVTLASEIAVFSEERKLLGIVTRGQGGLEYKIVIPPEGGGPR